MEMKVVIGTKHCYHPSDHNRSNDKIAEQKNSKHDIFFPPTLIVLSTIVNIQ
jgi:hypothetical protein